MSCYVPTVASFVDCWLRQFDIPIAQQQSPTAFATIQTCVDFSLE